MSNNMVLCSRCHKRPAVVFITQNMSSSEPQGLCLLCAKELGIKPVNDLMEKMGITDDQIESMADEMAGLMNPEDMENDDEGEDEFSPGGAVNFPTFLQNIFPGMGEKKKEEDAGANTPGENDGGKKRKKPGKNRRRNLTAYCTDLTARARSGELDPVIGREREISRVVQILSRRQKNNPCLIGEPGVGKTAIAEGLAQRIAAGQVPGRLMDKEVHLLDLTALVAGTQFRGQFESRIKGLIEEVKTEGNIILFIDEVHNLVGTGDAEGSMNAANILKPALSRGEIQVIGATTFTEYRKYIEKDAALERRFQPVKVGEPSVSETVEILMGIRGYYEKFHRVTIRDALIRRAASLSERYITDRFLPDKAIDLLDEACACASLRNKDLLAYDTASHRLQELRQEEENLTADSGDGQPDYEKLASIRWEIAKLEKEEAELAPKAEQACVEEQDLARVIELWTGIPSSRVQESELKKLGGLEEKLGRRIIGQDEAVKALASAIRRSRVQISPRRRPASFIFVGPTGVGKTELVKVLSQELFDSPETLIRLDMSEFMEKHSVSRIIGSPPGYVGYDEAGQVTEKVRRRPYSVLLFDEIEKAHPDVMNILLQILDEGRITDAQGRTVDFTNTVIVMTSNAGSNQNAAAVGFNRTRQEADGEKMRNALREFLRPEFLSRVDEVIVFRALNEEDFARIARLMLEEYVPALEEKGIRFTFDGEAAALLAQKAYGGRSGARDLRNTIRREVEDRIASLLVDHAGEELSGIAVTAKDGAIELQSL